jgi:hypothetical protein
LVVSFSAMLGSAGGMGEVWVDINLSCAKKNELAKYTTPTTKHLT